MLAIHPEVFEKIDWDDSRNTSRTRKRIGRSLVLWRPATHRALRGKAAPTIVADEIDAYAKKVDSSPVSNRLPALAKRGVRVSTEIAPPMLSPPMLTGVTPVKIGRAHV